MTKQYNWRDMFYTSTWHPHSENAKNNQKEMLEEISRFRELEQKSSTIPIVQRQDLTKRENVCRGNVWHFFWTMDVHFWNYRLWLAIKCMTMMETKQ